VTLRARAAELAGGVLALAAAVGLSKEARTDSGAAPGVAPAEPSLRQPGDVRPVASYTLTAELDPEKHTVSGRGTIAWVNASEAPVDHLWVHLYMNAFANEETIFRRDRSGGFRGGARPSDGSVVVQRFFARELGADLWAGSSPHTEGEPRDATDIKVPLPRAVAPGEALTIDVAFETNLPSVTLRAGYAGAFHMVAQWFPKVAKLERSGTFAHFPYERFSEFYADFGDYDVTIDTPGGFTVGATGRQVDATEEAGRVRRRFVQRAVHDFAFAAWDGFAEKTREASGVEIRCLFPQGYDAAADLQIDAAVRGLAFYGEAFGAYPYETLTLVHPPPSAVEAGGMEYPTLITTGGPEYLARLPVRALEGLTLHELGHQWFYGLVATNENAWPFLDEGLTTYATGEALRALYGGPIVATLPVTVDAVDRAGHPMSHEHAPIASRASGFATGRDYGGLVYARTATVLRTIDRVWDDAARRAVARYAREYRFAHPTAHDLARVVRAEAGDEAGDVFERAVFDEGWVDYEVATLWNDKTDEGRKAHVVVRRRGDLAIPVEIDLLDASGRTVRKTWDGRGDFARIEHTGPEPITFVLIDPEGRVLLDEDKSNDLYGKAPRGFAPRTFTLAALLAGLALTGAAP
jgi:hypothetical protein